MISKISIGIKNIEAPCITRCLDLVVAIKERWLLLLGSFLRSLLLHYFFLSGLLSDLLYDFFSGLLFGLLSCFFRQGSSSLRNLMTAPPC